MLVHSGSVEKCLEKVIAKPKKNPKTRVHIDGVNC